MILKDLPKPALAELLATSGISLDTGAYRTRVRTDVGDLARELSELYAGFPVETEDAICDFFVRISAPPGLRKVFRPQVRAYIGDDDPFEPMPRDLAMPLFESALNWCIATQIQRHLLLHAGVVAKDGFAVILPAPSGSGKSTLSAYLSLNGWRLLSDEFGIIEVDSGSVLGNPRPISLKNESIGEVSKVGAEAHMSRPFEGTTKGTVAFLRPFGASLTDLSEPCVPAHVIFPSFERGAELRLTEVERGTAFHRIIQNAVNYLTLGRAGFEAASRLVEQCGAFELRYSDYRDAVEVLTDLMPARPRCRARLQA